MILNVKKKLQFLRWCVLFTWLLHPYLIRKNLFLFSTEEPWCSWVTLDLKIQIIFTVNQFTMVISPRKAALFNSFRSRVLRGPQVTLNLFNNLLSDPKWPSSLFLRFVTNFFSLNPLLLRRSSKIKLRLFSEFKIRHGFVIRLSELEKVKTSASILERILKYCAKVTRSVPETLNHKSSWCIDDLTEPNNCTDLNRYGEPRFLVQYNLFGPVCGPWFFVQNLGDTDVDTTRSYTDDTATHFRLIFSSVVVLSVYEMVKATHFAAGPSLASWECLSITSIGGTQTSFQDFVKFLSFHKLFTSCC